MMKLALTLEADSVNVQALNMGRIVVDIDGVNLAELINMVCDNGYSLRVVDESDRTSADCTPPFVALTGIRCSTAHITETDNAWLYSLSHQTSDFGESEWIHFTGTGYLLRTIRRQLVLPTRANYTGRTLQCDIKSRLLLPSLSFSCSFHLSVR
ncbi:DUF5983 family protein, partial [Escherichia coli]|uniref:DUF5983 family protein n=1 Tax=Escherichia coli TaxID=562 RepID=UPI001FA722BF